MPCLSRNMPYTFLDRVPCLFEGLTFAIKLARCQIRSYYIRHTDMQVKSPGDIATRRSPKCQRGFLIERGNALSTVSF